MKRTIAVLALLTALALPAGCALGPKAESSDASVSAAESAPVSAEVSDTLDAVQGHWVDVNGDHTLDIDGKKLTLSYGQWSDTYRFKVERRGSFEYLVGRDPEGFGIMSELEVCRDGTLEAYEMVMDGPSYTFKFMREEDVAAALAVQDLSDPDAPKEIASGEIEEFSLSFDLSHLRYDLGDQWPAGFYSWQIEKLDDETCQMSFSVSGDSYMITQFRETVDREYVAGLAALIQEQGIPAWNGYYQTNAVDKPGYYLYVQYASGEYLTVSADGDPGDTCVFALAPLLDYAAKQDIRFYE